MGAVEKGISTIIRDEAGPGSSTAPCGASKTLMPKSTPSSVSAATAVVAQPTATAKRDSLLRRISARPRAVRHKAVMGFVRAKPQTQLDSNGSDAHQLMNAAAPIIIAAKPAALLARCLFRLPA
jgi:hypothetical protein